MHSLRASLAVFLAAALLATSAFATPVHRTTKAAATRAKTSRHTTAKHGKTKPRKHVIHGQQAIAPERATQIQQALIREHYLNGDATGQWDATSQAAMQKYQADHGWQTRLMPDSRALKSLGLGPDYSNAINARDSAFGAPASSTSLSPDQTAGFAAAAGVNR